VKGVEMMKMKVRKSKDRGHADHGWLKAKHSFSFADYRDPEFMGHSVLRVMNEDRIKAGAGFGTHPHRDMEILTYIISGALAHKDSMGNGSSIKAGEFQSMSAGTGIQHSEFNPSNDEETHLYQIWIKPRAKGLPTGYEEKAADDFETEDGLTLVVSPDGRNGSLKLQQDMEVYFLTLDQEQEKEFQFNRPMGWLQVITGDLQIEKERLEAGDGLAIDETETMTLKSKGGAQVLIFDLPSV
jgi:redox-sensitive bicupin YhaK (pirin superfamily)